MNGNKICFFFSFLLLTLLNCVLHLFLAFKLAYIRKSNGISCNNNAGAANAHALELARSHRPQHESMTKHLLRRIIYVFIFNVIIFGRPIYFTEVRPQKPFTFTSCRVLPETVVTASINMSNLCTENFFRHTKCATLVSFFLLSKSNKSHRAKCTGNGKSHL